MSRTACDGAAVMPSRRTGVSLTSSVGPGWPSGTRTHCSARERLAPSSAPVAGACTSNLRPRSRRGVVTASTSSAGSVSTSGVLAGVWLAALGDGVGDAIAVVGASSGAMSSHGFRTATTTASTTRTAAMRGRRGPPPGPPSRVGAKATGSAGRPSVSSRRGSPGSPSTRISVVRRRALPGSPPGGQPASGTTRPSASRVAWRRRAAFSSAPGTWSRAW